MVENRGYTGTRGKYEPVGVVHRGEFTSFCSCGGRVRAHWDGEIIAHTDPFDPSETHQSGGGLGGKLVTLWTSKEE